MRYFDDGDLTEGLAICLTPYPLELLLGYWHAVSTSYAGERTTVDYDDPESPALFRVELEQIDGAPPERAETRGPKKKRHRDAEVRSRDDLQVTLNYREWNLEFTGRYATQDPATVLHLSVNDSPDVGDVDNEATLAFGSVLDDRGYPFLRIMLSACEASSGSDDMVSVEIVAKKTDTTEVHKLELSKNERMRLGYAVRSDGQFEDLVGSGEPKDSYEELARKLGEHSAESARIAMQMQRKRAILDEQLREAVDAGRRVKNIYNEQRLSLPSRLTNQTHQPHQPAIFGGERPSLGSVNTPAPPQAAQQQQLRLTASAPRPGAAPRSSVPMRMRPGQIPVEDDDSIPILPDSAVPGTSNKGKKHCTACNRTVSLNHGAWVKHINSKKHAEQLKAAGMDIDGSPLVAQAMYANGFPTPSSTAVAGSNSSRANANPMGGGVPLPSKMPRGYALVSFSDDEDSDLRNNPASTPHHRRHSALNHSHLHGTDSDPSSAITSPENAAGAVGHAYPPANTSGAPPPPRPRQKRRRRRSGETKGETQWCTDCQCQISVKNWNIHTRSQKHQMNSNADGLGVEGREPAPKRQRIDA